MSRVRVPVAGVLHLLQSDASTPDGHHFGLDIDDFQAVYERGRRTRRSGHRRVLLQVYKLPDGAAQLYLWHPAGNMVEVNHPDAASLDTSVIGELEQIPTHTNEAVKARLYL